MTHIEHRAHILIARHAAHKAERAYTAAKDAHRASAALLRKWVLAKARLAAMEVSA